MNQVKKIVSVITMSALLITGTLLYNDDTQQAFAAGTTTAVKTVTQFKSLKPNVVSSEMVYEKGLGLFWDEVDGSHGYQVYRAQSKKGSFKKIGTITNKYQCSYFDSGQKIGKIYYYKIRAYRTVQGKKVYSKYSDIVSKRVTFPSIYIEKCRINEKGNASITINKVSGAKGYYIYHSDSPSGNYAIVKKIIGNKSMATFNVPTQYDCHYIKVVAYITIGDKKYFGDRNNSGTAFYINEYKTVEIKDSKLKNCIIDGMGDIAMTRKNLSEISSLTFDFDLSRYSIPDFSFLKYCSGLKVLNIENSNLRDLKLFTDNINASNTISELNLTATTIENIDGIQKMTNLQTINFDENPIRDFTPIESLTKLENVFYWPNTNVDLDEKRFQYTNYMGYEKACNTLGLNIEDSQTAQWAAAERVMDNFIGSHITSSMSDYDKIKAVHDFIVNTMTYGGVSGSTVEVYRALVLGKGICHDYASAFAILTSRMGFEVRYVSGYNSLTNKGHAWNIIKLDGNYYHVDCTWDDPVSSKPVLRYDYFLVSDKTLTSSRNYPWDTSLYPACPYDYA